MPGDEFGMFTVQHNARVYGDVISVFEDVGPLVNCFIKCMKHVKVSSLFNIMNVCLVM